MEDDDDRHRHEMPEWAQEMERRINKAVSRTDEDVRKVLALLTPGPAVSVTIMINGKEQTVDISVDATTGKASLNWADSKGNPAAAPDGVVVTWTTSDAAVLSAVASADSQLVADIAGLVPGAATVGVSFSDASGNPVPKADGSGNFDPITSEIVNVTAGGASSVAVALSV